MALAELQYRLVQLTVALESQQKLNAFIRQYAPEKIVAAQLRAGQKQQAKAKTRQG